MKKIISLLIVSFLKACMPNPTAEAQIILTMCHSCVFPISIGGVQVVPGIMPDPAGVVGSPICVCPDPFPRIGIPVSFFEPSRTIEILSDPFCFPTLGVSTGVNPTLGGRNGGNGGNDTNNETFYQAHFMIFPAYAIIELFTDLTCLEVTGVDYAYITEVDPLWNDDVLGAFISPEALLFGNPISSFACIADSVSTSVYFPLDPLFWCMGSWGNVYPLTGHKHSQEDNIIDTASIAGRIIYKMHRQLLLWGSWGQLGLCGYYPMPIWRKTAYRLQPIMPIPHFIGITIGQTGTIWSFLKDYPGSFNNFGYLLFKKRDCCAF